MPLVLDTLRRPSVAMLAERLVKLACGALLTVLIARQLGAGSLGVFSIVTAWAAFLVPLSSVGLNNIVVRLVSEQSHQSDAIRQFYTAVILRLVAGLAGGMALLLVYFHFTPAVDEPVSLAAVGLLFVLQGLYSLILFEFLLNYQGHFHQIALWKAGVFVVAFALKLSLILAGLGVSALIALTGLEFAMVGLLQYVKFRQLHRPLAGGKVPWPHLSPRWFSFAQARALLARSAWLWGSAIVSVLYLKVDILVIGALEGGEQAGLYAAASRLSELWYVFPATLAARYYPDMLERYRRSEADYYAVLRRRALLFVLAGVAVAVFMSQCAHWIVTLLFGLGFAPAAAVLQVHVWAGCFFFVQYLVQQHLLITGQEPLSLLSHGAGAVINLLLNLWLIPRMGIIGAAWATLAAYAFASFFFLFLRAGTRQQLWLVARGGRRGP